jgi:hypothetical protein
MNEFLCKTVSEEIIDYDGVKQRFLESMMGRNKIFDDPGMLRGLINSIATEEILGDFDYDKNSHPLIGEILNKFFRNLDLDRVCLHVNS